jgi:flagellar biogenesis protein FliO
MTAGVIGTYLYALAVVAVILLGMVYVVRLLNRQRIVTSSGKRLITVVESQFLAQNTTLHVVKVADRYYLVGGGMGHVSLVGEVPADSVGPWLEQQRTQLDLQRASVMGLIARVRGDRK